MNMQYLSVMMCFLVPQFSFAGGTQSKQKPEVSPEIRAAVAQAEDFMEQGLYVIGLHDPAEFQKHWKGFVNRSNTEWKDSLLKFGFDPQVLYEIQELAEAALITGPMNLSGSIKFPTTFACPEAYTQYSSDLARCDRNPKEGHSKCMETAKDVLEKGMILCGVERAAKEVGNAIGRLGAGGGQGGGQCGNGGCGTGKDCCGGKCGC